MAGIELGEFDENPYATAMFPSVTTQLPWWYDAKGQKQVSYAHSGFPGQMENCDCHACMGLKKFQQDQVINDQERAQLRDRSYVMAHKIVMYQSSTGSPAYNDEELTRTAHIIYNELLDTLVRKQQDWQKNLQTIQLAHRAQINDLRQRGNRNVQIRKRIQASFGPGGRLFRTGEETDGTVTEERQELDVLAQTD